MKKVTLSLCSILVLACQPQSKTPSPTTESSTTQTQSENPSKQQLKTTKSPSVVAQYNAALDTLLTTLAGENESKVVDREARQLFKLSRKILTDFIEAKPECAAYLKALLKVDQNLLKLTPEAIESGYHRDGLLPKNDNPTCHHAKDLMVHPATVVVLNMQSPRVDRVFMQKEVFELKAHLNEVLSMVGSTAN